MLLKNIKLSGFKSFVDPITVTVPSSLVGIVGPNGCGKSNVIDAVRWVMGESSAKTLRGESMDDVIFNGSSARPAVNRASVELTFDNTDGTITGEFASYAEISIRREVTREGQSNYYLNGTRCRRKDITAVFLGTGLGPRTYSIIQQGMISRLIEAKPEELRGYLEEAAGISKYKERRRETENRIRHTRDNLERLADIRLELEKQLAHLKRQANAAERYQVLRQEQRQTKAQSFTLKWKEIDTQIEQCRQQLSSKETELESHVSKLRQLEGAIEHTRIEQAETSDFLDEVQGRYYSMNSQVAQVDQTIKHQQERKEQLTFDFREAQTHWQEVLSSLEQDQAETSTINETIFTLEQQVREIEQSGDQVQQRMESADRELKQWQEQWNTVSEQFASASQETEVGKTNIEHFQERLSTIEQQADRIKQELAEIDLLAIEREIEEAKSSIASLQISVGQTETELTDFTSSVAANRSQIDKVTMQLDAKKQQLQEHAGTKASLTALQEAALGCNDEQEAKWARDYDLSRYQRLAQQLTVERGWELAIETVLGNDLQAFCVDKSLSSFVDALNQSQDLSVTLLHCKTGSHSWSNETLASKVSGHYVPEQLGQVLIADSLAEALAKQKTLVANQSIITQDGVWLGNDWVRIKKAEGQQAGILARENELRELNQTIVATQEEVDSSTVALEQIKAQLVEHENARELTQKKLQEYQSRLSQLEAKQIARQEAQQQMNQRKQLLNTNASELADETSQLRQSLVTMKEQLERFSVQMRELQQQRDVLEETKEQTQQESDDAREAYQEYQQGYHMLAVNLNTAQTKQSSLQQNIQRISQQCETLSVRKIKLEQQVSASDSPFKALEGQREQLLEKQLLVEDELSTVRTKSSELDQAMRAHERTRQEHDESIQQSRSGLEGGRLEIEGHKVRKQTISEQLEEMDFNIEQELGNIDPEASSEQLEAQLEHIGRRITRLGAINLAAIDEYQEKDARKQYLDQQNDDLEEALATLESAMAKIDKETRQKFRETYEAVNRSFQELFPKVFAGGSAQLELTGQDLLDTGVVVIARPPGKKNSTIHMLSGGEKALVALALVFSIFQLNPAPFCMLDEVDAPLDDVNVSRYCDLVKEMSSKVQFIVITHNKITMEMMHQLTGVTMHEPGVSRLVSVDIGEAVEMVDV